VRARESGRERGGDKPYESRNRGASGVEIRMRFRYGMGLGLGSPCPCPSGLDPIRFDGVSTLLFLFDLLLCLSPALARSLAGWRRPGRENLERDGDGASSGNPQVNGALTKQRRPAADGTDGGDRRGARATCPTAPGPGRLFLVGPVSGRWA
jgi:hypothetical protein